MIYVITRLVVPLRYTESVVHDNIEREKIEFFRQKQQMASIYIQRIHERIRCVEFEITNISCVGF